MILVYINQEASEVEIQPLLKLVSMSIEVLEIMADECFVAGRSAKLLQKALEKSAAARHQKDSERLAGTLMSMSSSGSLHHGIQTAAPVPNTAGSGSGMGGGASSAGAHAALTPADSEHDGSGVIGAGGPWPDPAMAFNWMHSWAPVNLLDNEMLDFDLTMPFTFDNPDMNSRPG